MGEIRIGPAGLPADDFDEAADALAARGYRACEIGFAGGFWLDYDAAPLLGEAILRINTNESVTSLFKIKGF